MLPTNKRVVIVAMDRSEYSQNAFEWYRLNVHAENDKVILLHIPEYEDIAQSALEDRMETDSNNASKDAEIMTLVFLEKLEQLLQEKQLKGEVRTEDGDTGKIIVSVAEQENADLIVIGNRGIGNVQCAKLGTVSDYVINHTPSSVILCKGYKCSD